MLTDTAKMFITQGVTLEQFYTYDFEEINILLDAHKLSERQNAMNTYRLAMLTASFISAGTLGGKAPSFEEAFPELQETQPEKKEPVMDMKTKKFQAEMMAYAQLWNDKRKRLREEGKLDGISSG